MTRGDWKDILGGALFLAIGLFGAIQSLRYEIGTAQEMGSGYMPLGVFSALALLGAAIAIRGGLQVLVPAPRLRLRPLLLIVLATSAFALLLRSGGFFAATLVLVVVASFADSDARRREAVISGVVLAVFGTLVFSYWLGVSLPIWPWSE